MSATIASDIRRAWADPLFFGQAIGYTGRPDGRYRFGSLHRRMVDFARENPRCWITVPRRHAKTTLMSEVYGAWSLIRSGGEGRVLIASATLSLAAAIVGNIRKHLSGQIMLSGRSFPLSAVFPWAAPVNAQNKAGPTDAFNIVGRSGMLKEPNIFIGAPGSNMAGKRPTLAVLDDITNEQNVGTATARAAGIEFVQQTEILMYDSASPMIGVSTPWAPDDVTEWVRSQPNWKHLRLGCYDGVDEGSPPGPDGRFPLCPSFMTAAEIEYERATKSAYFFSTQFLCEPTAGDRGLFTPETVSAAAWGAAAPPSGIGTLDILLFDPVASVDGRRPMDKNGIVVVRAVPVGRLNLPGCGLERDRNVFFPIFAAEIAGGADTALAQIERWISEKKWPALAQIWVEDVGAQAFLVPWARDRGRIGDILVRGQRIPAKDLSYRLQGISTAMRQGYCRLPVDCEGRDILVRRLTQYPLIDHDDLLAALALLSSCVERTGSIPGAEAPAAVPYELGGPGPQPLSAGTLIIR